MHKRRVTIAQISDLHINRKVKPAITDMLKAILQDVRPDVLVVSGDLANQPVPWQMKKAANLVREIWDLCRPARVIVIPGNHDVKFWGNFGLRRLTRIPFEIYFRRPELDGKPFWLSDSRSGWTSRARAATRLALNALWWKGQEMREPVIVDLFPDHPEWGLAVFAVNSNSLAEMMAAGKVESHDLQQLYAALKNAEQPEEEGKGSGQEPQKKSERFAFRYKVAVVHHHPAPIAEAPTDAIARIQDSFMIFYNAGRFMQELSRRRFNLVLHGHKHVAGFLRVGCEFKNGERTVLPVAAAGSASHPAPDDTRGHHLHVIEIFDDDTASLESWFFSEDVKRKEDESRVYELDRLDEDVRQRRCAIFKRSRQCLTHEVIRTVEITEHGYSQIQEDYLDNEVVAEEGLKSVPLSLRTERPTYLRDVTMAPGSSRFNTLKVDEQSLHSFKGSIRLQKTWGPRDGRFTYGYCYRLINGHALTAEDFQRHYSGLDAEYASITCDGAYELMTLEVKFPEGYNLSSLEFSPIAEYVPAPLRGIDDERLDRGADTKRHDTETERIRPHGRLTGRGYVLTIPKPVPGMVYRVQWKFPSPDKATKGELKAAAEVAGAQRTLLELAASAGRDSGDPAVRARWDTVRAILGTLAGDISKVIHSREKLRITAMVFDTDSRHLKFVCTNMEPQEMPSAAFFAGEGCAGFAFDKVRSLLYHAAADDIGYFIREKEWVGAGLEGNPMSDPVVLASFPWVHKPPGAERGLIVGVINVSSRESQTALLQLFDDAQGQAGSGAKGDDPQDQATPIIKSLEALVNLAATGLLKWATASMI
jgi:hypothetical protein